MASILTRLCCGLVRADAGRRPMSAGWPRKQPRYGAGTPNRG